MCGVGRAVAEQHKKGWLESAGEGSGTSIGQGRGLYENRLKALNSAELTHAGRSYWC